MSNFPTSLDNLSEVTPIGGNPPTTSLGAQNHSQLHRTIHEILNDLEAKLGIDGSAVTTSHDYKLSAITGVNRAVGRTETATLLGKTIDGDDNTLQDIALASLKTILADASKFIVRDAAGAVVSSKAVPVGDVVGTTDQQIQVLPRLDRPGIGDYTYAGHNHTTQREGGRLPIDAIPAGYNVANLIAAERDWTPTYSNITVGNGTVVAKYVQIGIIVFYRYLLRLGSTSAIGASPNMTPPVRAAYYGHTSTGNPIVGTAHYEDNAVGNATGTIHLQAAGTELGFAATAASNPYSGATGISSTVPFTWATGDELMATGFYFAADNAVEGYTLPTIMAAIETLQALPVRRRDRRYAQRTFTTGRLT